MDFEVTYRDKKVTNVWMQICIVLGTALLLILFFPVLLFGHVIFRKCGRKGFCSKADSGKLRIHVTEECFDKLS